MPKRRSILQQSRQTGSKRTAAPTPSSAAHAHPRSAPDPPGQAKPQSSKAARPASSQRALRCASAVDAQAAEIVGKVLAAHATGRKGASVKSLALAPHVPAKKAVYAVSCNTLAHSRTLLQTWQASGLADSSSGLADSTALVLLYELLLGEGLRQKGPAERVVLAAADTLRARFAQLQQGSPAAAPQAAQPKSVRVNTLKGSTASALALLQPLTPETVTADEHIPDVLWLPPGLDLHSHPAVLDGRLLLQSWSSCLPALALGPQPGWHVVDACAAPGNKTSHLAALMAGEGKICAFDKDAKRAAAMKGNMTRLGAGCVEVACADFLATDLTAPQYAQVRGALVDPSCSGSGTAAARLDVQLPGGPSPKRLAQRLQGLASFQAQILAHALTLPSLERLVYSTCSVHAEENEGVVAKVLPQAQSLGFELASFLPAWPRRGLPGHCLGHDKLLRVDPDLDKSDGFFVAVFQRTV